MMGLAISPWLIAVGIGVFLVAIVEDDEPSRTLTRSPVLYC
ncbi:MAG: hypothetical protein ACK5IN_10115 [Microbacterium sp.]